MTEINHDNVLIQLRDALNRNNIKLWEEPYCVANETNENEIVVSRWLFAYDESQFSKKISLFNLETCKHSVWADQHQIWTLFCGH